MAPYAAVRFLHQPFAHPLSLQLCSNDSNALKQQRLATEKRPEGQTASIAVLMSRLRSGESGAAEQLVDLFYDELRRLASAKMRGERAGHTLQPTALVNELFLELVKIKRLESASRDDEHQKAEFMALSAHIMRRLLIAHSRLLSRQASKVTLDPEHRTTDSEETLHQIENLLSKLEQVDPKLRSVVEMRVFEGLTNDEIAERLHCAPRSVIRYWIYARNWLEQNLSSIRP